MAEPPDDRVRVVWLTKGLGPGGAERLLVSFARLADHERFDIRAAYLLPWKNHLVGQLEESGVPAVCLHGSRDWDPRWALRLRGLIVDERIDVVHVHSPVAAAATRLAVRTIPRSRRPRVIGTEHNDWASHHPATRLANRLTIRLQDVTIAVSEQVRDSMPKRLAASTEIVIHGVDVEAIGARHTERAEARAELGVQPDEILVVTVANLRANKDYPILLHAARKVVDSGLPFRFVSVGQGPLEYELAAERDRLGLGDRFAFLGYREDPIRVMVAGDIFCLSSRYEGLPIALLEAMAAGLAVVATSVGAVPDLLNDGQDGVLIEPANAESLGNGLKLLADGESRRAYSAAALRRAESFGTGRALARHHALYEPTVQTPIPS